MSHFYGVFANTGTVLLGSLLGFLLHKGIPEKLTDGIMKVLGLCTIAIAIPGILKGQNQLIMIISLVLGTALGTLLDIDGKLNSVGDKLSEKLNKGKENKSGNIAEGFVTASLLFCIGAMTIVGSINAGVSSDNEMLYTKSLLDLISSTMLSASLGIGVMFAAAFVFVFQGGLVCLGIWLGSFLSEPTINEIICAGSVMILAIGINLISTLKLKVADMLPALLLVPLVCMLFS